MSQHVAVKDLSAPLQDALKAHGYGRQDIRVEPGATIDVTVAGGAGQRGFVTVVNLDTGRRHTEQGSWGGANMFGHNDVDTGGVIEIPRNGAVIKGTRGGGVPVWAYITAHPDVVPRLLPSGETEELSDLEQHALYCFACIKGGAYRSEELARRRVPASVVDGLVERGYLKRNRAGATAITTKGKNAPRARF